MDILSKKKWRTPHGNYRALVYVRLCNNKILYRGIDVDGVCNVLHEETNKQTKKQTNEHNRHLIYKLIAVFPRLLWKRNYTIYIIEKKEKWTVVATWAAT